MQADVFEIAGKSGPRQSLDVFEKKSAWSNLSDSAYSFGEHIPVITMTTVFSSKREWLTRWSAGNQIDTTLERPKINLPDIFFDQRPLTYRFRATTLIFTNGVTTVTIPFNHGGGLETRVTNAHAQATRAREQFNDLDFIHLPESS